MSSCCKVSFPALVGDLLIGRRYFSYFLRVNLINRQEFKALFFVDLCYWYGKNVYSDNICDYSVKKTD